VYSVKGAATLNISQYCHYRKDKENQLVADKERSIVLKSPVYYCQQHFYTVPLNSLKFIILV